MYQRILALIGAAACLLCVLGGCVSQQTEQPPQNTTTATDAAVTTLGGGTTTVDETTATDETEETTVATDAQGNTLPTETTTSGKEDITTANGADGTTTAPSASATTTDKTTARPTTTNNTTARPTTTTAQQEQPSTPSGILPGSPEAGVSFATLARAPQDAGVTVTADTKQFGRFLFTTSDNRTLPFNVACHVTKDRITALLPANADLSALKPNFTYYGHSVLYNGAVLTSRSTAMDLTDDVTLTLKANNGSTRTVTVHIERLSTDLPSFSLTTSGYSAINNTVDYKAASFSVGDAKSTVKGADCSIKGRGNTSWTYDKKSYTLRFDTKYSLLGLRESKNYVLLAMYADQSLMRYRVGEFLSKEMGLEFTMQSAYVDLWLNGEYQGVYALVEKIEVEPARVDITDYVSPTVPVTQMGYLLEFDDHLFNNSTEAERKKWKALGRGYYDAATNEVFFYSDVLGKHWLTIRTTNAKNLSADHVNYIALVVEEAAKALKKGDWATVSKWMDVESFVNWYLIMEYLNNTDTDMASSVYMYIDAGGKLKLGPLWDLDNCAGNHKETVSVNGHPLYDSKNGWFSYLFAIPEAKAILKSRAGALNTAAKKVPALIDATAAELRDAAAMNFVRWDTLGSALSTQPTAIAAADTYDKQVAYLKKYLTDRQKALNTFYSSL